MPHIYSEGTYFSDTGYYLFEYREVLDYVFHNVSDCNLDKHSRMDLSLSADCPPPEKRMKIINVQVR